MKKYILFIVFFIVIFEILQIVSGMFLTMLYTPSNSILENSSSMSSHIVFGSTNTIPTLIIALLALAIAFGTTQLLNKKINYKNE